VTRTRNKFFLVFFIAIISLLIAFLYPFESNIKFSSDKVTGDVSSKTESDSSIYYSFPPKNLKIEGDGITFNYLKRDNGFVSSNIFTRATYLADEVLIDLPYLSIGRYLLSYSINGESVTKEVLVGVSGESEEGVVDVNCLENNIKLVFAEYNKKFGDCIYRLVFRNGSANNAARWFSDYFQSLAVDGKFTRESLFICQNSAKYLGEAIGGIYGFNDGLGLLKEFSFCENNQHYLRGLFSSGEMVDWKELKFPYENPQLSFCLDILANNKGGCYTGFNRYLADLLYLDSLEMIDFCNSQTGLIYFGGFDNCVFVLLTSFFEDTDIFNATVTENGGEIKASSKDSGEILLDNKAMFISRGEFDVFQELIYLYKKGGIYSYCERIGLINSSGCLRAGLFAELSENVAPDSLVSDRDSVISNYISYCNGVGGRDNDLVSNCIESMDYSLGKLVYIFDQVYIDNICRKLEKDWLDCSYDISKIRKDFNYQIS
jgi:hypothetical protein